MPKPESLVSRLRTEIELQREGGGDGYLADLCETAADALEAHQEQVGLTTQTGHEVGAIYEDTHFGGAYVVLGEDETGAVEVEQVVKGRAGKHFAAGSRWTHRTALDHTSRKIGYAVRPSPEQTREHDAYVDCLDGGWRGFQAACFDCDWRGPAAEHRKDTARPDCNQPEQDEVEVRLSREEAEAVRSQLAYLGHKIGSASIHTRTLYRSATAKLRTALEEEGG